MYQIKCDNYIIYDPRDEELVVINPKCNLEVNTVGGAGFTILATHPYYHKLKLLKSVFEIRQDNDVIFRGRMTGHSRDFDNMMAVDLEGLLAVTNDTVIPPFDYPAGFSDSANAENVIAHLLHWALEQHNAQVTDSQKLKLGNVTVTDPNNYITRSSTKHLSTWEFLKTKFFGSDLGGYLTARYEDDGTYVDYLADFSLTNTQRISIGENLLDIKNEMGATETYSAILPLGKDDLTIESLSDGELNDDLVKEGKFIYSKSAVESYGWICVPLDTSTWSDVTVASNLQSKAMQYLSGTGMLLSNTITVKAVDLAFTDEQIQSFRINRNVLVDSPVHGVKGASYPLLKLDIDLFKPQNTTITIGGTETTLVDINDDNKHNVDVLIQSTTNELKGLVGESTSMLQETILEQNSAVLQDAEAIILSALERYTETLNYDEFKETVESELKVMAESITMNFTSTTEQITDINGDLQMTMESLAKHFDFSVDGLTIKAGENDMQLKLDNDSIKFLKNGQQFGYWDGVDFHTGNIIINVDEKAQFGNFAFVPRSDGSLMFLKVNG